MKFLKKLKSSNFWVSMISAVVLILQAVFNIEIKAEYLSQIIMAMLGFLVMSGIVTDSNNPEITIKNNDETVNIKDAITNALTQITATLEAGVIGLVKQMEVVNGQVVNKDVAQAEDNAINETMQSCNNDTSIGIAEDCNQVVQNVIENCNNNKSVEDAKQVDVKTTENVSIDEQNVL